MKPLAKQIVTFLCLVFLFSSLPYFLMINSGHIGAGGATGDVVSDSGGARNMRAVPHRYRNTGLELEAGAF
jgi:hypothetical protein